MYSVSVAEEITRVIRLRANAHYELDGSLPLYLHEPLMVVPSREAVRADLVSIMMLNRELNAELIARKKQAILDKFKCVNNLEDNNF